jgi:hypothetical protein
VDAPQIADLQFVDFSTTCRLLRTTANAVVQSVDPDNRLIL